MIKKALKEIRYLIEAGLVWLFIDFFKILKLDFAVKLSVKITKFIGKKLSVHKLAYDNLSKAMPDFSEEQKNKILDEMWENLGRNIGEFVFISNLPMQKLEDYITYSSETKENILALKNSKKGGIIFSGHLGNWEIGPKTLVSFGLDVSTVYRPLNNPYVEEMISNMRQTKMIAKGSAGNREIIKAVKDGGFVIILADQKVTDGEPIRFFHDDAITTTSIARIALKYDVPIIAARANRIAESSKFYIELEKPLQIEKTDDVENDIILTTCQINKKLESWIKEHPSQWFCWLHDRWKK